MKRMPASPPFPTQCKTHCVDAARIQVSAQQKQNDTKTKRDETKRKRRCCGFIAGSNAGTDTRQS